MYQVELDSLQPMGPTPNIILIFWMHKVTSDRVRSYKSSPCMTPSGTVFADGPLGPSALTLDNWMLCHKMAKGGKLEPRNWHVLSHLL